MDWGSPGTTGQTLKLVQQGLSFQLELFTLHLKKLRGWLRSNIHLLFAKLATLFWTHTALLTLNLKLGRVRFVETGIISQLTTLKISQNSNFHSSWCKITRLWSTFCQRQTKVLNQPNQFSWCLLTQLSLQKSLLNWKILYNNLWASSHQKPWLVWSRTAKWIMSMS